MSDGMLLSVLFIISKDLFWIILSVVLNPLASKVRFARNDNTYTKNYTSTQLPQKSTALHTQLQHTQNQSESNRKTAKRTNNPNLSRDAASGRGCIGQPVQPCCTSPRVIILVAERQRINQFYGRI